MCPHVLVCVCACLAAQVGLLEGELPREGTDERDFLLELVEIMHGEASVAMKTVPVSIFGSLMLLSSWSSLKRRSGRSLSLSLSGQRTHALSTFFFFAGLPFEFARTSPAGDGQQRLLGTVGGDSVASRQRLPQHGTATVNKRLPLGAVGGGKKAKDPLHQHSRWSRSSMQL